MFWESVFDATALIALAIALKQLCGSFVCKQSVRYTPLNFGISYGTVCPTRQLQRHCPVYPRR
jgi:hypothetical protein